MTREKGPKKRPTEDRRGLTNGNGVPRPAGLTNGLGRTNGTGRTNGLTNGLTNGVRGRTNGLTNGLASRANGLTNGLASTGRTNGMTTGMRGRTNGLTNGSGRTNGTGVINGLVNGTIRRGLRHNRYGVITQRDLRLGISIVVLFLLLLGPFYLLMSTPPPAPPTRILVDGNLADWAGTPFLNDTLTPPNADIALRGYSVLEENGYTSFAIRVAGIALGDSSELDGFYIFIDKDGSAATGYRAREIGADYMVSVRGGNNAVSSSALYGFRSGAGRSDWGGWEAVDSARAAVSANGGLEVQLLPGAVDWGSARSFLVAASDYDGNEVMGSVHFDLSLRALQVQQVPTADYVTTSNQPIADLTFTAFGAPVVVTRVQVTGTHSGATLPDLPGFTVTTATPVTQTVTVAYTPAEVNDYVVAHVDPTRVETTGGVPVTVDGPDLVAYLLFFGANPPTQHFAEGYFRDWAPSSLAPDPGVEPDANIDISHYAANHTVTVTPSTSTAFVYADVADRIFGGSGVVERIVKATGGGGGGSGSPGPPVTRVGEDLFRVFIDVDTERPSDGTMSLGVRADYRIDITGTYGRIASKTAYEWSGTAWVVSSRTVNVANDRTRMEASLDLTGVTTGTMAMAIEATDWRLLADATDAYGFLDGPVGGTRGGPGLKPLHGTDGEDAVAQSLTNGPAAVDGDCATTGGEYDGAGFFDDPGIAGQVGTDGLYVYVCIDVTDDISEETTDQGYIYFDTAHNGGTAPDSDDRRFYVVPGGSIFSSEGNGVTWVPCVSPNCDSGNEAAGAFTGGHEVYEFKIRFANVWGTDSPTPNDEAGFAVRAVDSTGGITVTWGSTDPPSDSAPDTWGHILAPEFHDILVPVAVVGVIYFVARRRRRNADS